MPKQGIKEVLEFTLNNEPRILLVEPHWTLSQTLREQFGLTGCKEGCGEGACGACTVIIDGAAIPSCMVLAIDQKGKNIETVEGLEKNGTLHPVQQAFLDEYGAQCGFCTPGMIMSTKALLDKNPTPTTEEIKEALAGNVCMCRNYEHIMSAVLKAAEIMREVGHAN